LFEPLKVIENKKERVKHLKRALFYCLAYALPIGIKTIS
jgi:hypothetical protein